MGLLALAVFLAALYLGLRYLMGDREPDPEVKDMARRAYSGAREVGNTFLGSMGGQSLPDLGPPPPPAVLEPERDDHILVIDEAER